MQRWVRRVLGHLSSELWPLRRASMCIILFLSEGAAGEHRTGHNCPTQKTYTIPKHYTQSNRVTQKPERRGHLHC